MAQTPLYPDHTKLLLYRSADGAEHPVRTPQDWETRRAHILAHMQAVMGLLPDASRKVSLDLEMLHEENLPRFTRRKITFGVEPGDRASAYLLIPHGLQGDAPAV